MRALLAAALAVALPAAAREGRVLQVTGKRAYLDSGSRSGLAAGIELNLSKKRVCTVERVADRYATCKGEAHVGDRFALPHDPPSATIRPPPKKLKAAQQKRRLAALEAATTPLVDFTLPSVVTPARDRPRARVALSHSTWAVTGSLPYQQERADASLHAPLAGPLRTDLELTALRWSTRPATAHYRPNDPWQLLVREASLSAGGAGGNVTLGRQRPLAPSATLIDGLQADLRGGSGRIGVYAGAMPDPFTTAAGTDRLAAGATWLLQTYGGGGDLVRFARHEGRATAYSLPGGDHRVEVEAAGFASLGGALDLSGEVRFAAGALAPDAGLDSLRLEANARLGERVRASFGVSHQALPFPADVLAGKPAGADTSIAFTGGPSRHADLSASWNVTDGLSISALSGLAADSGAALHRAFVGPEIALARVLGSAASLSAGYLEERGWLEGRSAWIQAGMSPEGPWRGLLRLNWSLDRRGLAPGSAHEIGLFAAVNARVARWLDLRASLLGRSSLDDDSRGLAATVGAAGEF